MNHNARRYLIFTLDGALLIGLVYGWFGSGCLFGLELFLFHGHYHIEGTGRFYISVIGNTEHGTPETRL
jgi:hypothetical protein